MADTNMTETGNASDPNLTEEAYARSIGMAGKIPPPPGPRPDRELLLHRYRKDHPFMTPVQLSFFEEQQEQMSLAWEYRFEKWKNWMEAFLAWRKKEAKKLHAGNNGAQLGPREFTLTYGTHYESDEEAQRAMTQAIERLTRYYKDEIIEFHAVGEFTKAGRAHVHGWYHLDGGKKITDKNFKRAYPPWNPKKKLGRGFEGGHHATIDRVSDFHGYTEKHLQEAWLVKDITNDANDTA